MAIKPASGVTEFPRQDLSDVAMEYMTDESRARFIGFDVMPIYPVAEQNGAFSHFPLKELLKLPASLERASDGTYQRVGMKYSKKTFATEERGIEVPVDERDAALTGSLFDAEMIATERAIDIVLRTQEKRIATAVDGATVAAGRTQAAGTAWDVHATADPRDNWLELQKKVRNTTGVLLNALEISWNTWLDLIRCSKVIESVKYTGGEPFETRSFEGQTGVVAAYMGVSRLLVGDAQHDTASRDVTATLADLWLDTQANGLVVSDGGDLKRPQFGRVFLWRENSGPGEAGTVVESYREPQTRNDVIRVRHEVEENVIHSQAIGRITGIKT